MLFTAPFNNMRTLKLKAQLTNTFFATVNQVFGGTPQLTTTAELCLLSELCTTILSPRARQHLNLGGAGEHLIDGSEKRICRLSFGF